MAKFEEYIAQAKSNITFLDEVDNSIPNYWDWKVTTAFYIGVHLVNAHLKHTLGYTYRTHKEVENAINFANPTSLGKVTEDVYVAYSIISKLSRRSRYIIHEKDPKTDVVCLTYDRHFKKSLIHLNTLLEFVSNEYKVEFEPIHIDCIELQKVNLKYFKYKKLAATG
ncbi:hypothetical protein [Flagellimonas sp.]|uniref:hypothetical protein n=1 Tax=Flagellimonas sp. TaxID=2058762 RepID=UPI003BA845FA